MDKHCIIRIPQSSYNCNRYDCYNRYYSYFYQINFRQPIKSIIMLILLLNMSVPSVNAEFYQERSSASIYKVSEAKQEQSILQKKLECFKQMMDSNYTLTYNIHSASGRCPISWDRIRCWSDTAPGVLRREQCPNYVDSFRKYGWVTKLCTSSGVWYKKNNVTWTNYTDCLSKNTSNAQQQINNIHTIGLVGYGISMCAIIIAIGILCSFRRLRCDRNYIHLNLFIAFLFRAIFSYPTLMESPMINLCRPLRVANNYFIQASYQSIFTEALYMHNMIFYHTFDSTKANYLIYIVSCWVIPGIVMLVWSLLRYKYNNVYCWDLSIDPKRRDFWFLNAYVILLTLANCVLFGRLTYSLCSKVNSHISREREKYRKLARSICVLVIVFGVYNVMFIPMELLYAFDSEHELNTGEIVRLYCLHLVNSCQGFLVSLLLCFVNGEVHREVSAFIQNTLLPRLPGGNARDFYSTKQQTVHSRRSQVYDTLPTKTVPSKNNI